jgi:hypothetical protein
VWKQSALLVNLLNTMKSGVTVSLRRTLVIVVEILFVFSITTAVITTTAIFRHHIFRL